MDGFRKFFLLYVVYTVGGSGRCIVRGTGSDGKGIYRGLGGISVGREGVVCVFGGGGIVRGTGSDGKGIYRGLGGGISGGDCSVAKRSVAERIGA